MRTFYLPFRAEYDPHRRLYTLQGEGSGGEVLGTAAGRAFELAQRELYFRVLDRLMEEAGQGRDATALLRGEPPAETRCLRFAGNDVFPVHLRAARVRLGLRAEELARRLAMDPAAYLRLERPGSNPTLHMAWLLEQALGAELLHFATDCVPVGAPPAR